MFTSLLDAVIFGIIATLFVGIIASMVARFDTKNINSKKA